MVVLATAGYDRTVRFWDALSGVNYRTIQSTDTVTPPPPRRCVTGDAAAVWPLTQMPCRRAAAAAPRVRRACGG